MAARFACTWPGCEKTFSRKNDIKRCLNKHNGVVIRCSLCDSKSTQLCHMKKHMMTHTGEKPHTCYERHVKDPSRLCGASFLDKSAFNRHQNGVHGILPKNPRKKYGAPSTPQGGLTSESEEDFTADAHGTATSCGSLSPANTATSIASSPQMGLFSAGHVEDSLFHNGAQYVSAASAAQESSWDYYPPPMTAHEEAGLMSSLRNSLLADNLAEAEDACIDPALL